MGYASKSFSLFSYMNPIVFIYVLVFQCQYVCGTDSNLVNTLIPSLEG